MMTFLYSFRYATGQHELMSRQRAAYLQYIIETLIASSCLFPSAYTNFLDTLSILYITETYCFHIIAAAPGPWYRDRNWFDMPPAMQAQYTMAAMLTPPLYRNVPNNHFSASGRFLGSGRSSVAGLWLRQVCCVALTCGARTDPCRTLPTELSNALLPKRRSWLHSGRIILSSTMSFTT